MFYTEEPRRLLDEWVGRRVAVCPNCGGERWYGYGPCQCGSFLRCVDGTNDRVAHTKEAGTPADARAAVNDERSGRDTRTS